MRMIALLRGVNVGGNRKVPMPELCTLAAQAGLREVAHYINSGNLVFEADKLKPEQVASGLERAIGKKLGFHVDVIVRTAMQWRKYQERNPFSAAAKLRPNFLHLGLSKLAFSPDTIAKLRERAAQGERLEAIGADALWIDFAKGVGKSKLTPALLDRAAGSTVTLRNYNTVLRLDEILGSKD